MITLFLIMYDNSFCTYYYFLAYLNLRIMYVQIFEKRPLGEGPPIHTDSTPLSDSAVGNQIYESNSNTVSLNGKNKILMCKTHVDHHVYVHVCINNTLKNSVGIHVI